MVTINFADIESVNDFEPLPDGEYNCRLAEIIETFTHGGDDMWKLQFVVEDGKYTGRYVFDNMVFSERAYPRIKLICHSLGLDVAGQMDLEPAAMINKRCVLTVMSDEYIDDLGKTRKTNTVPFNGYKPALPQRQR